MGHRVLGSLLIGTLMPLLCVALAHGQPLTAVNSDRSNLFIKLIHLAKVGGAPIDASVIRGDAKLYIAVNGSPKPTVIAMDPTSSPHISTLFLSFADFPTIPVTGQGIQGIAFSPNFTQPTMPGFHKFYTYEQETAPAPTATSIMFLHPEVPTPVFVAALREWTANATGTAIDTSIVPRVVLNFGTPAGHMGGGLKFGPDGYLYLSTGDGGGNGDGGSLAGLTDGFTGRTGISAVPGISNGQDFTNLLGKVIRIDPYITNGDGTPRSTPADETAKMVGSEIAYFIPNSNPFVGNSQNIFFTPNGPITSTPPVAPLGEVFAFGFRNPWKLSFDKNAPAGAFPFVADVGSRTREEIDIIEPGKDYGWPYREGLVASATAAKPGGIDRPGNPVGSLPFFMLTSTGFYASYNLNVGFTYPTKMQGPVAELGTRSGSGGPLTFADKPTSDLLGDGVFGNTYGDTNAVVGGFVYRGTAITDLVGMYVFGGYQYLVDDPSRSPATYPAKSSGGSLYYFDPAEVVSPGASKTVRKFVLSRLTPIRERNILGISEDINGQLYVLFENGDIDQISQPPRVEVIFARYNLLQYLIALLAMLGLSAFIYVRRRRAGNDG